MTPPIKQPEIINSELTQDLFSAGLELMLAGMGTVFIFLTLLVLATVGMSAVVQKFVGSLPGSPTAAVQASSSGEPSAEELAAITAAIHQHRRSGS